MHPYKGLGEWGCPFLEDNKGAWFDYNTISAFPLPYFCMFKFQGDSSATLGKEQSLADLIKRLQLRRKKKEVAAAASAAIETVPNGNLGAVFSETLKPSNLNPSLPVAKMLELAKDGIVSLIHPITPKMIDRISMYCTCTRIYFVKNTYFFWIRCVVMNMSP